MLGIVSFGWQKVIEKALQRMDLLKYFKININNDTDDIMDDIMDENKSNDVEDNKINNYFIIGRDSKQLKEAGGNKATFITNIAIKKYLRKESILFVDDDKFNIAAAIKQGFHKSILIEPRNGMTQSHIKQIENLAFK